MLQIAYQKRQKLGLLYRICFTTSVDSVISTKKAVFDYKKNEIILDSKIVIGKICKESMQCGIA